MNAPVSTWTDRRNRTSQRRDDVLAVLEYDHRVRSGVELSAQEARWIAIDAQGLGGDRPTATITRRHLRDCITKLGTLQLDTVNVVERTQFLVLFSRLGPYEVKRFHKMNGAGGDLFEYWGHAASLVPMSDQPLLRWRMSDLSLHRYGGENYATACREWIKKHGDYVDTVLAEVADRGPLTASQLDDPRRSDGEWWDRRSLGRQALEWLFERGQVIGWRQPNFERVYDLPERVIPARILAMPSPTRDLAQKQLLCIAARAHGVGTARDLADYFRIKPTEAKPRLNELVESGDLVAIRVDGWRDEAFILPNAQPRQPTRIDAALLTPFDSLIWERARTKRLFNFEYKIEIYTPKDKRTYGYFVLPMLLGDQLVARFDLKADRKSSQLLVRASHGESGIDQGAVAEAAALELQRLATWLGLERIVVERNGDLSNTLGKAASGKAASES